MDLVLMILVNIWGASFPNPFNAPDLYLNILEQCKENPQASNVFSNFGLAARSAFSVVVYALAGRTLIWADHFGHKGGFLK